MSGDNEFQRLADVKQRIERAARNVGRDPQSVRIVAVSKTKPVEAIMACYQAGQRDFGENRVQEFVQKVDQLPQDCRWHIVGRLQTNKVKYLDHRVTLIHSLDRLSLLQKLEEIGQKKGIVWPVLVQVNVAHDEAKAGLDPGEVADFLIEVSKAAHVKVQGLMTIGRLGASEEETRGFFRELRELRDRLQAMNIPGIELKELSMGMSDDFEIAVEEGATIVRIGRQIFGERD